MNFNFRSRVLLASLPKKKKNRKVLSFRCTVLTGCEFLSALSTQTGKMVRVEIQDKNPLNLTCNFPKRFKLWSYPNWNLIT